MICDEPCQLVCVDPNQMRQSLHSVIYDTGAKKTLRHVLATRKALIAYRHHKVLFKGVNDIAKMGPNGQ
jgi:hypothetical protein